MDKLEKIHKRFENGTETIEDIMHSCLNYIIKTNNELELNVVETKYFNKLVKYTEELQKENEDLKQAYKQQADIIKNSVRKDKLIDTINKIDDKANRIAGTYQYSDSSEDLACKKAQVRYYEYFIRELEELLKGDE